MNTLNLRMLHNNKEAGEDYALWHPYASINKNILTSLDIVSGEDVFLYDVNGKRYLDAASGLWNISLGYSNQAVIDRIKEQLDILPYCSLFEYANHIAIEAADNILSLLPSYMKKVLFTCSGSESIETAVKLMRMYWGIKRKEKKKKILSIKESYHGTYFASLSASSIEKVYVMDLGLMTNDFVDLDIGICTDCEKSLDTCKCSCMKKFDTYIADHYEEIAGIIIEPILASAGVKVITREIMTHVVKICRRYEILITLDEVATGFYRTGRAFYFMNFNIVPDILCLSKGINSGYMPFGAVVIRDEVTQLFVDNDTMIIHGSTQDGNLLACASCNAAIDQYKEIRIEENVIQQSKYLIMELHKRLDKHINIKSINGVGLIIGIELCQSDHKSHISITKIVEIQKLLLQKGLIVYRSDIGLIILPMLIVTKKQVDFIIKTICDVFSTTLL